jgi:hypothetical protein
MINLLKELFIYQKDLSDMLKRKSQTIVEVTNQEIPIPTPTPISATPISKPTAIIASTNFTVDKDEELYPLYPVSPLHSCTDVKRRVVIFTNDLFDWQTKIYGHMKFLHEVPIDNTFEKKDQIQPCITQVHVNLEKVLLHMIEVEKMLRKIQLILQ